MSYRILFTDFDGTLRSFGKDISETNLKAISAARAAGKHVVLCSGRSWKSMAHYEPVLGMDGPGNYGIAFQGAAVYANTTRGREFLRKQLMETDLAHEIIMSLTELKKEIPGADLFVYGEDGDLFAGEHLRGVITFSEDRGLEVNYTKDLLKIEKYIKILMYGAHAALLEAAARIAPKFEGRCGIVFSAKELLEFVPHDVNKGQAIAFLAGHLGIPIEETIAVGDEANDTEMLKRAGLGVAVANGTKAAKDAADIVLDESCEEDAVSVVINKYLL